ncbi:MFS transporter [Terriglobus sp.]|uniref:MFS transporter n=1 Tax=Terriglobus sp. TaxID=1889013 RepID=UPI003AFF9B19
MSTSAQSDGDPQGATTISPQPAAPEATPPPSNAKANGFAPLKYPLFRDRWIASTVSNLGTWMQDTSGTWLMTALTGSPLLIALMQTAASAPVLLLGVFAGATADIFERRRLLIFWQTWQMAAVALLAVLAFAGIIGPVWLLLLTFLMNIGSAMNNPAWQAIVPELIPRSELPNAVALASASNNLARAVGPALGGLLMAAFLHATTGAGWTFALNAVSFAAVIWVLYVWKRQPLFRSALPAERLMGSVETGFRFLRYSPVLQATFVRAFLFTFSVAAVWSLLAVVARRHLGQGALGYGILNGSMGFGAVLAAFLLAKVRARFTYDQILAASSAQYISTLLVLAFARTTWPIILFLIAGGFAWVCTMSSLNVSVQLNAPGWVQARALGMYQMVFQGGLAIGSVVWGYVAEHSSVKVAMCASAASMAITLPFTLRLHVMRGSIPDLSPYQWKRPVPHLELEPQPEDGPVRILIDYNVPTARYNEFVHAIHQLRDVRLRSGAIRWGVFRDGNNPERLEESFVMESWLEYLRSRERMTTADATILQTVRAMHQGEEPPRVTHQVYAKEVETAAS